MHACIPHTMQTLGGEGWTTKEVLGYTSTYEKHAIPAILHQEPCCTPEAGSSTPWKHTSAHTFSLGQHHHKTPYLSWRSSLEPLARTHPLDSPPGTAHTQTLDMPPGAAKDTLNWSQSPWQLPPPAFHQHDMPSFHHA